MLDAAVREYTAAVLFRPIRYRTAVVVFVSRGLAGQCSSNSNSNSNTSTSSSGTLRCVC